jgi:transposase, IS5 family
MCDLDDRETVEQISENIYMQYFLGYSSFSDTVPFDASLFVEFRKRLGLEQINALNERILQTKLEMEGKKASNKKEDQTNNNEDSVSHKGSLIIDATACPQDIAFPTDLNLLNDAREKLEQLMDFVFDYSTLEQKPRNYREIARKEYLKVAQKKSKTRKDIRSSIRKQLAYVGRNISIVNKMLDHCETIPFDKSQYKYK